MEKQNPISGVPPVFLDKNGNQVNMYSKHVPLTDKEMVEALENTGNYEMAGRIKELKQEVANLKRKLTTNKQILIT